ncbi:MAG: AraC family transcriptional regulator [Chthoniobacteraceae bacterium]
MTSSPRAPLLKYRPIAGAGGLFVSPGYGTHPDRLADSWELIFVRTGCLHIEEAGVEYRVNRGESLLMLPGRRHRGLSEHPAELSFYWVHFILAPQRLPSPLQLPQHVRLARPERLAEWFHQYIADQTVRVLTPLAGESMLLLMLNETMLPADAAGIKGAVSLVRKAEEYISHQMRNGISPGAVSRAVGYNTAHLSRLFRRIHGVTLGGFIHRIQIAQARTLLQGSASPLKQIASQCGFRDVGYFRRLFHRGRASAFRRASIATVLGRCGLIGIRRCPRIELVSARSIADKRALHRRVEERGGKGRFYLTCTGTNCSKPAFK